MGHVTSGTPSLLQSEVPVTEGFRPGRLAVHPSISHTRGQPGVHSPPSQTPVRTHVILIRFSSLPGGSSPPLGTRPHRVGLSPDKSPKGQSPAGKPTAHAGETGVTPSSRSGPTRGDLHVVVSRAAGSDQNQGLNPYVGVVPRHLVITAKETFIKNCKSTLLR